MKNEESRLQQACITWFRLQYPKLSKLLFAVPNGSRRDAITGAILKKEGVVSGVADLILLIPKKGYSSLCIGHCPQFCVNYIRVRALVEC